MRSVNQPFMEKIKKNISFTQTLELTLNASHDLRKRKQYYYTHEILSSRDKKKLLKVNGQNSGGAILPQVLPTCQWGSTLKGKNLLP